MSTQVKRRRGTAAENAAFTGAQGEMTYMTDTKRLAVHDAVTAGGAIFLNADDIAKNVGQSGTVGGSANAITLTNAVPVKSYANGLEILIKPTANNTGATTVDVDGLGTVNLEKMVAGVSTALAANDLRNGVFSKAIHDGTRFQLQTGGGASISNRQIFTGSGTWTKPSNYDATAMALIEVWGAGGGGTGGASGSSGGSSSFGSVCVAYAGGGAGGGGAIGGAGGGVNATPGSGVRNDMGVEGQGAGNATFAIPCGGYFTGGGGGNGTNTVGAASVYGGGGGGGATSAGGASSFGGAGGAGGSGAGTAPGGGGGGSNAGGGGGSCKRVLVPLSSLGSTVTVTIGAGGAGGAGGGSGARGECRVTVLG